MSEMEPEVREFLAENRLVIIRHHGMDADQYICLG